MVCRSVATISTIMIAPAARVVVFQIATDVERPFWSTVGTEPNPFTADPSAIDASTNAMPTRSRRVHAARTSTNR